MANKYIRKVSTGADVIGGLKTSRYEKLAVSFGVIEGDQYANEDVLAFSGIPSGSAIIDGKITIHEDPPTTLAIGPATVLTEPLVMDTAGTAKISYVIRSIKGSGNVGASRSPLTINFDSSSLTAPAFSVEAGTYGSAQTVAITTAKTDDSIRYTIDGSTPSATVGTVYTAPISVDETMTVKAIAYKGTNVSAVTSKAYVITA